MSNYPGTEKRKFPSFLPITNTINELTEKTGTPEYIYPNEMKNKKKLAAIPGLLAQLNNICAWIKQDETSHYHGQECLNRVLYS